VTAPTVLRPREWQSTDKRIAVGYVSAVALMLVAKVVPPLFDWDVRAYYFSPLSAFWDPRFGPGTIPAVAVGGAGVVWGPRLAATLPWRRLLVIAFAFETLWLTSLATVDGWDGIGVILNDPLEYLNTARSVSSVSTTLHEFISRTPIDSSGSWPAHVAGHPPGALLFFVTLVALGLGSGLAAGLVVLVLAATTVPAVMATVRALGAEDAARSVAPLLLLSPAAIWMAVSADGMFGAVTAWGLCSLAIASTAVSARSRIGWGLLAGFLLGCCLMLSYGLTLLGVLAVTVMLIARNFRPVPWVAAAAASVVLAFAVAGFSWWVAFPVLRTRYWAGIASSRPTAYWLWGDPATLVFNAGPAIGVSVILAIHWLRARPARRVLSDADESARMARVVALLTLATVTTIALADLSLMSKAETERIWVPFVPWLLLGLVLVPDRWRRPLLIAQVAFSVVLQTLLFTRW
jgi:hypothetical protein